MDKKFTEQESLAVISEMIDRARNNVQKGSGTFMIYWGSMVAITALLNIVLVFVLIGLSAPPNLSFNIWWIMLPAWIGSFALQRKRRKSAIVKSHIDNIISSVWYAFGISMAIFIVMVFGFAYSLHEYSIFYMINPIIILITGIGEFITARACRFRPFLYGAFAMWTGSLFSMLATILFAGNGALIQFGILAVCMVIGFVVPGYKLNKLAKKHHV
ncbi:MAG: hypothetical protein LBS43_05505 [Prevotellaceae bacterium]|nr:hypothetical protein [Prevotellaceae bacterium]